MHVTPASQPASATISATHAGSFWQVVTTSAQSTPLT
jgi:hypothetical protein